MQNDPLTDVQELIINRFPSPIAINYKRILLKETYQDKVRQLILTFEFTVRSLALVLISQYLLVDREKITDAKLNKLLRDKLPKPSLGSWVEIIFTTIGIYKGHRDILFINELHDAYWAGDQQKPRKGIRESFDKLVNIRNRLSHELPPSNEAEWQILFLESHTLLLNILEFIRFVSDYELIYVLEKNETELRFQVYKGQNIIRGETLDLIEDDNIGDNWFYLSKSTAKGRKFLKLYPFLIAWEKDADITTEGIQNDAALLDKFSSSSIYYLATLLWKNFSREDEDLLADFFYNYEKSLERKKGGILSWETLRTITHEIVGQNIGDTVKKYNSALYLDRIEIRNVFEDFITSDKTCLVITGKSGVGKTNFVMATIEALRENVDICALAYDGARLSTDRSLSELIKKELENRIELATRTSTKRDDLWEILSAIPAIQDKHIIIFVDAINENPNASALLQKIDFLIGSNPYPWLKFVITSRPESWRVMNRKIKLANHKYYWQHGEEEMGVELKEFSMTDPVSMTTNIDKFSRDEANLAYQKYKKVFGLITDYDDLAVDIRHAIQDPLILRLIAEIYRDSTIPVNLHINKIYADFVDALIKSGRLARKDIHFVNREIVSRMADGFTNSLTENVVFTEKELYEALFNTDTLSNGEQINQSFENLINAEILAPLPLSGPINVSFKYERFYDYFLGEYFYYQFHNNPDKYQKLVQTIQAQPFLWGATKNALIKEFENGQIEFTFQLACQSDQTSRELAIATLTEYGQNNSNTQNLIVLLRRLLLVYKEYPNKIKKSRFRILGKSPQNIDQTGRSAAMTALEVSRRLMLADILEEGAQNSSQPVRVIAMRNIYYYWRMNRNEGFEILDRLAEKSTSKLGFPQTPIVESCIGISMLIMMHYNPHDNNGQEIGARILETWRKIIRRLLLISENETAGIRVIRNGFRNFAIKAIVRFVISTQKSFPASRPSFLRDVTFFFKSESAIRQRYERLINFFSTPGKISDIHEDLMNAVTENDALTCFLIFLIINTEGVKRSEDVLPIIEKLIDHALAQPVTGILACYLIGSIGRIGLSKSVVDDNYYRLYEKLAIKYLEKTRGFFYSNIGSRHNNLALGEHSVMRQIRKNPDDEDLYKHFIKNAVDNVDWEFLDALLLHDLIVIAYESPRESLESMKVLFPIVNTEVLNKVAITLATIRVHHPELVSDFLLEMDINNTLHQQIARLEITENPWSHLFATASGKILLSLLETQEIREEFAWIMRQVTHEKNLENLLNIGIRRLINKISGYMVFKTM